MAQLDRGFGNLRTIALVTPWENGSIESIKDKLRDELPNREVFDTQPEAKTLIERWRRTYNTVRLQSSLGNWAPALEVDKAG